MFIFQADTLNDARDAIVEFLEQSAAQEKNSPGGPTKRDKELAVARGNILLLYARILKDCGFVPKKGYNLTEALHAQDGIVEARRQVAKPPFQTPTQAAKAVEDRPQQEAHAKPPCADMRTFLVETRVLYMEEVSRAQTKARQEIATAKLNTIDLVIAKLNDDAKRT